MPRTVQVAERGDSGRTGEFHLHVQQRNRICCLSIRKDHINMTRITKKTPDGSGIYKVEVDGGARDRRGDR